MSDIAQNAERDFWTPPVAPPVITVEPVAQVSMVEACDKCETEFIPGARYCHVCGAERLEEAPSATSRWLHHALETVRHLELKGVERWIVGTRESLGFSLPALIFTVQTTLDWQAVQVWRIEWLLGASASFLAAILLKKSAN